MSTNEDLKSDFSDLARECGKTKEELKDFVDPFEGRISLVTERSVLEYLSHRDQLKAMSFERNIASMDTTNQMSKPTLIDLNQLMSQLGDQSEMKSTKPSKRSKQAKPYVSPTFSRSKVHEMCVLID